MNKYLLAFIIFIIILTTGLLVLNAKNSFFGKKTDVKINGIAFTLDVADTEKKRENGLSGRATLGEKQGMLFVFDSPATPSFWMKGMKFPLDILFIKDNKIVTIYENIPALDEKKTSQAVFYQPTSPVNRVIELKAGSVKKHDIKEGQTVSISL
ncbi:MAG: DUF192 domain-containing protein [Candidatus Levybacteria bacterium]|nr:DUF192 domain-containing protein [Candidatus Levybacteria bacterium]